MPGDAARAPATGLVQLPISDGNDDSANSASSAVAAVAGTSSAAAAVAVVGGGSLAASSVNHSYGRSCLLQKFQRQCLRL